MEFNSLDLASYVIMAILAIAVLAVFYKAFTQELINKNSIGRNHCGIVTNFSSGGDIHFDEMNQKELLKQLESDFRFCSNLESPCINAAHKSHLAEYRIFTNRMGKVKTIGYITKDKVVFEGKTYYFGKETF